MWIVLQTDKMWEENPICIFSSSELKEQTIKFLYFEKKIT